MSAGMSRGKERLLILIRAVVADEPPARIREIGRGLLKLIKAERRQLEADRAAISALCEIFSEEKAPPVHLPADGGEE